MKPFSAVYYIKNNRKRSIALIILIATISISYLGGLYVTNPFDTFKAGLEHQKDYFIIHNTYEDDENQLEAALLAADQSPEVGTLFNVNTVGSIGYRCIMGYDMSGITPCFQSSEAFTQFNKVMNLMPADFVLKDGEFVMSEKFAKNLGLTVGDILSKDYPQANNLERDYRLAGTYLEDAYTVYLVDKERQYGSQYLVSRQECESKDIAVAREALLTKMQELKTTYPKPFYSNYDMALNDLKENFNFYNKIYYAIVILIAIVLSITINATFSGAYEKRKYEFSIYKAIGFSNREVSYKIIREILLINLLGVLQTILLTMAAVYLLNNLLLVPNGMAMKYINSEAVLAIIGSDLLILLPVILARTRVLKKYDVTVY